MGNLKRTSHQTQIESAENILYAFKTPRYQGDDHLTHSDELKKKRNMFLRNSMTFAASIGFKKKLNHLFTYDLLEEMFMERLDGLKASTAEGYIRQFSSMLEGLKEKGISIEVGRDFFDDQVAMLDMNELKIYETNRALSDPNRSIAQMYQVNYISGVLSELIVATGFRISEAFAVLNEPDKYLCEQKLEGVIGKGNHVYIEKSISWKLAQKIFCIDKVYHQNTFRNHLKLIEAKPHDLRYTYVKQLKQKLLDMGIPLDEVRKIVSIELNHCRAAITVYYEKRA